MDPINWLDRRTDKFAAHLTSRAMSVSPGMRDTVQVWVELWGTYGTVFTLFVLPHLTEHIPNWELNSLPVMDPDMVTDLVTIRAYDEARNGGLESAQFFVEIAASAEPVRPGEFSLMEQAVLAGRVMEFEHALQRDALEERLAEKREAALDAASKEDLTQVIHALREQEKEERDRLEARQAEERAARDAAEQARRLELEQRRQELRDREAEQEVAREAQTQIDREAQERQEQTKREEASREAQEQMEREARERAEQEERAREEAERAAKESQEREAAAKEQAEREAAEAREEAEREAAAARERAEQEVREAEERRTLERELSERER